MRGNRFTLLITSHHNLWFVVIQKKKKEKKITKFIRFEWYLFRTISAFDYGDTQKTIENRPNTIASQKRAYFFQFAPYSRKFAVIFFGRKQFLPVHYSSMLEIKSKRQLFTWAKFLCRSLKLYLKVFCWQDSEAWKNNFRSLDELLFYLIETLKK